MSAPKNERLKVQLLALDNIAVDHELQSRFTMSVIYMQQFTEAMVRGDQFPPVTVFFDGKVYWLADGFHRHGAASKAALTDIRAEIHYGTRRDAIIHSAGCNKAFSIPRTDADKKKAASMLFADREWLNRSADAIAKHVGVKGGTIIKWRQQWCRDNNKRAPKRVITASGIEIPATAHHPGSTWKDKEGQWWGRLEGKDVKLDAKGFATARRELARLEEAEYFEKRGDLPGSPLRMQTPYASTQPKEWHIDDLFLLLESHDISSSPVQPVGQLWPHLVIDLGRQGDTQAIAIAICVNPTLAARRRHDPSVTIPHMVGQLLLLERYYRTLPGNRLLLSKRIATNVVVVRSIVVSEWDFRGIEEYKSDLSLASGLGFWDRSIDFPDAWNRYGLPFVSPRELLDMYAPGSDSSDRAMIDRLSRDGRAGEDVPDVR